MPESKKKPRHKPNETWTSTSNYTYVVRCPQCGRLIQTPFYVHDHPVIIPFLHNRPGSANCRLLVVVRPDGEANATVVPPEVKFEDALGHFRLSPRTR